MTGLEKHPNSKAGSAGSEGRIIAGLPAENAPRNRMLDESETVLPRRIRRRPENGKRYANGAAPALIPNDHAVPLPDRRPVTIGRDHKGPARPLGRRPPVPGQPMDSHLPRPPRPDDPVVNSKPRGPSALRTAKWALKLDDPLGLDDETLAEPVREFTGLPKSFVDHALLPITSPIRTADLLLRLFEAGKRGAVSGIAEVVHKLGMDAGEARRLEHDLHMLVDILGRHSRR